MLSPSLWLYTPCTLKWCPRWLYGPVSSSSVFCPDISLVPLKAKTGREAVELFFQHAVCVCTSFTDSLEGPGCWIPGPERDRDTKRDRVLSHTHRKDFGLWFYHLFRATRGFIVEHCSLLFLLSNKQNFSHFLQGNLSWNGWGRDWPESDFSEETPFGCFLPNLSKTGTSGQ